MAKVMIMCGKICSGKSTHSNKLKAENHAVILSVDEITLALFGQGAGEKHDYYVEKLEEYLYQKSLDIIEAGINVILDWGFWTKNERAYARHFYGSRDIEYEFYYIDIDDGEWNRRLEQRNREIVEHRSNAYLVDSGLAAKFGAIFEKPDRSEIDVWVTQ